MKTKDRIFLAGTLVLSALLLGSCGKKTATAVQTTAQAEIGTIQQTISVSGSILPKNRLEVQPPLAGRIETVAVNEGDYVRKGQTLGTMSSSERASMLDAARSQGEANLKYWESVYKPVLIVSPMNGTVIVVDAEPGQTINAGDSVFVISDRLIAEAQIDETDIGSVRKKMPAIITLDAYPSTTIQAEVGHISFESTVVNNVTQYKAEILPVRVPDFARSGMSASIEIIINKRADILLVPSEAVQEGKNGAFVLIPSTNKDGRPAMRQVKTGASDDTRTEIISGLKEGEKVLVSRTDFKLDNAAAQETNPFMPKMPGRQSTKKKQ